MMIKNSTTNRRLNIFKSEGLRTEAQAVEAGNAISDLENDLRELWNTGSLLEGYSCDQLIERLADEYSQYNELQVRLRKIRNIKLQLIKRLAKEGQAHKKIGTNHIDREAA